MPYEPLSDRKGLTFFQNRLSSFVFSKSIEGTYQTPTMELLYKNS